MRSLLLSLLLPSALAVLVILHSEDIAMYLDQVSPLGAWGCGCDSPRSVVCNVTVSATAVGLFCTRVSKISASFPPRVVTMPASCLAYSHSLFRFVSQTQPRPGLLPSVTSGDWPARQHDYVVKIKTLIKSDGSCGLVIFCLPLSL